MFPKKILHQPLHLEFPKSTVAIGMICSVSSFIIALTSNCAKAEIIPDDTLGNESSVVTPLSPNFDKIDGGAIRGTNLFHSFEQFNINEGRGALFTNPTGIENIIGRVTGGSSSEILGTLGVVNGSANLFLINPNGIIFGPNAKLGVGGSFVGTTANAIRFGDSNFYSASVENAPPLLTIKPSALQFNRNANQPITIQSKASLQIPGNRSLLLVGGDVNLEGGLLRTQGGQIGLGGLAGAGTVGLNVDGNNLSFSFSDDAALADISLSNKATVETDFGRGTTLGLSRGDIQLVGRLVTVADGSEISASTLGTEAGGTLTVSASELVKVTGGSRLLAETEGTGNGGELTIETEKLSIRDGSEVAAGAFKGGSGGKLKIKASEVELIGTSADGTDFSSILTQTNDTGNAGELVIETKQLIVRDGARISTATRGSGQAGKLTVTGSDSVKLIGTSTSEDNPVPSGLFALSEGSGKPGDLTIETSQLIVQNGARALSSNLGTATESGTLNVKASELVQISGTSSNGEIVSGLGVVTEGTGKGGELTIETPKLQVQNGAAVSASTFGKGEAGNVTIKALEFVELIGTSDDGKTPSRLTSRTSGKANAGNLTIETGQLNIKNGAEITTSSAGQGSAGNAEIQAESINLDQGNIISQTASGDGGNITLSLKDLLVLRDRSQISSTAGTAEAGGDGGNIIVNAENGFIIAAFDGNSDITANAFEGKGGRIEIDAIDIFGMVPRSREDLVNLLETDNPTELDTSKLPTNDITAFSQQNPDFSGSVEIITPQTDPTSGSIELPTIPVNTEIVDACSTPGYANSSFTITGKGSLPPSPLKPLTGRLNRTKLATLNENEAIEKQQIQTRKKEPTIKPIVEARGWIRTPEGKIILVAYNPRNTNFQTINNSGNCNL